MAKGTIRFTIDNKDEVEAFAQKEGFRKASELARYLVAQCMQHPLFLEKSKEIEAFALDRGFKDVDAFARFAGVQYMNRYGEKDK